ncbi:putative PIN domain protein [Persephonella marina EX-H1]|uniref:Putative PIN domain protein n=2 Tax=Hydrogenothermaceae TaxID=224027 RepID=C0QQ52_PERMH|nr:putative PIN domain protein [Persephonella marina EX-H1]
MNKRFFIDSNIFIEALKKNPDYQAKELISYIYTDIFNDYYINDIVFSEVYYHLIIKGKLTARKKENDLWKLISSILFLNSNFQIIEEARNLIKNKKLKTNDALILSTVKNYQIPYLISLDNDFSDCIKNENIKIISKPEELKTLVKEM